MKQLNLNSTIRFRLKDSNFLKNKDMTPTADDQLAAVLDEIAEMERCEGFEGPKISDALKAEIQDRMKGFRLYPEIWEDHVVGEIWRACDVRGWMVISDGPFWLRGERRDKPYRVQIIAGMGCEQIRWAESRALAAARAYRDALKETMK